MKKKYIHGFLMHKIQYILKSLVGTFHWAQTSYFWSMASERKTRKKLIPPWEKFSTNQTCDRLLWASRVTFLWIIEEVGIDFQGKYIYIYMSKLNDLLKYVSAKHITYIYIESLSTYFENCLLPWFSSQGFLSGPSSQSVRRSSERQILEGDNFQNYSRKD